MMTLKRRVLGAGCLLLALASVVARSAEAVVLAEAGVAKLPVVVAADASPRLRSAAKTLAESLSRLSGAAFSVAEGDGQTGIVLGLSGQWPANPVKPEFGTGPFAREDYVLQSRANGLWLLGASELAVEHAVWDLLYLLGYRQFFPGATWEVWPPPGDLRVSVDRRESPAFYARRIWYNWGFWGYNQQPYTEWCARNRHTQGFRLNSGHAYEAIIAANKAEFAAHPEYFSLVKGVRHTGGDAKFCHSNPALRQLVVDHAVRQIKAKPDLDSLSMDPSDGDRWCECEPCAQMGSISDRALTLANEVATAINALGLGDKFVGMYAYNRHSPPPSIAVHPKVVISATTAFITGGLSLQQITTGWQKQGATLGIYDYFSVMAWDWNQPGAAKAGRPAQLVQAIREFHREGARFYDAESGDAWGPYGLGYYLAARVMWDTREADRVAELVDDFVARAFGPAKEPMAQFYHLLNFDTSRRPMRDRVGRLYRHLAAARTLAAEQPAVMARLDHLPLYLRFVELYQTYANAQGQAKPAAHDAVVAFTYRHRQTMMIHAYGFWARTVGQKAAADPAYPLKDDTPVSAAELQSMLEQGIAANQPVEMGFEPVNFSEDWVPATPLGLPDAPAGSVPTVPQDFQVYYLWLPEAPTELTLTVTVQKVWALRPHSIKLFSPQEVSVQAVASSDIVKPDGQPYTVTLATPHVGLHRLELRDGGDYTRLVWPDKLVALGLPSGMDTPSVSTHFRGPWTLYCYVPKGTKVVGGWAARVAAWAPRISGTLHDGEGTVRLDFGEREDGWFSVAVPPGQDGKVWRFEKTQGMRQLMTIPPMLARRPSELLLPREVLTRDQP